MKTQLFIFSLICILFMGCFTAYESPSPFENVKYDYSLKGCKIVVEGFTFSEYVQTGSSFSSGSASAFGTNGSAYGSSSTVTAHYSRMENNQITELIQGYLEEKGAITKTSSPDIIIVGSHLHSECVNWSSALKFIPLTLCTAGFMIGEDYESSCMIKVYSNEHELLFKHNIENVPGTCIIFSPVGPLSIVCFFLPQWMHAHKVCAEMTRMYAIQNVLREFEKELVFGRFDAYLPNKRTLSSDSQIQK